jgi:lysophospholipase L1-like esterase
LAFGVLVLGIGFALGAYVAATKAFPYAYMERAKRYVLSEPLTRPNPRKTIFEAFHPKAQIVMIGDSLTERAPWNEMFPGVTIANRGVDGDTTTDILARMDTVLSVAPSRAFIMAGINDFHYATPVDAVAANIEQIAQQLISAGIPTTIQSTIECTRKKCAAFLDRVRGLNDRLSKVATRLGVEYIDLNASMADDGGLLANYSFDGVHLNGQGYRAWQRALARHIEGRTAM